MNASIDVLTLFLFNIVLVNIPLLYQLSYRGEWRRGRDLNPRPPA